MQDVTEAPWENEIDGYSENRSGCHLVIDRDISMGFLRGYVGVPEGHIFYGITDTDGRIRTAPVHKGITYADHINHKNFDSKLWYIGFDAAHVDDLIPFIDEGIGAWSMLPEPLADLMMQQEKENKYLTFKEVHEQVQQLYDFLHKNIKIENNF